jgi:hypothetical protein
VDARQNLSTALQKSSPAKNLKADKKHKSYRRSLALHYHLERYVLTPDSTRSK